MKAILLVVLVSLIVVNCAKPKNIMPAGESIPPLPSREGYSAPISINKGKFTATESKILNGRVTRTTITKNPTK